MFINFIDFGLLIASHQQVLELARERFDDCTYVFEAHHPDFVKSRKILQKVKIMRRETRSQILYSLTILLQFRSISSLDVTQL